MGITHNTHTHIYKYIYSQATLSSNGGPKADVISYYYFSLSLLPPLFKKKKKSQIPTKKKNKDKKHTHGRQILMYIKSQKPIPKPNQYDTVSSSSPTSLVFPTSPSAICYCMTSLSLS